MIGERALGLPAEPRTDKDTPVAGAGPLVSGGGPA